MSSHAIKPALQDFIDAYDAGAKSVNKSADVADGSVHNVLAGVGALLWTRQVSRDMESFRGIYLDSSEKTNLNNRIIALGGPARISATRGSGTATMTRATTLGGAGTFWAGTRIMAVGEGSQPLFYRVTTQASAGSGATTVAVPIEWVETGPGGKIDTNGSLSDAIVTDPIWDESFTIARLVCADGTDAESDAAYLARYRSGRTAARKGYADSITAACVAAGATNVALFESDAVIPDGGINRCFVSYANGTTNDTLLRACRTAVDSARVCGCDMTVWGMSSALVTFDLTVSMWNDPSSYNVKLLQDEVAQAVLRYFGGQAGSYVFSRGSLAAEITQTIPDAQNVTFGSTCPTDTVLATAITQTSLVRMYTDTDHVTVTIVGPQ